MSLFKPIHHTFAPHVNVSYCLQTLAALFQPWKWQSGKALAVLRSELARRTDSDVFLFASGRESLLALLKALNLQTGEEVIVQGYTCVVVPNAVHTAGGVPVYADIDRETLNLIPETVAPLITHRTRAVICQHTFGIPAESQELKKLCAERGILLIEDCAHILPDQDGPESVGKHGDFVFHSFGRDKAISAVTGGVLLSRNSDASQQLRTIESGASSMSMLTILRLLLYPLIYSVARPFYGLFLGKALLVVCRKMRLLMPYTTKEEKEGHAPQMLSRLPNAFAILAINQLRILHRINQHRRKLTTLYSTELRHSTATFPQSISAALPLQKFPLFVKNPDAIRSALKKHNIHLKDGWSNCVVCPSGSSLEAANYEKGTNPQAEAASTTVLSLPTHPTMTIHQAKELLSHLQTHLS